MCINSYTFFPWLLSLVKGFLPSHALKACALSTDPHGRFCWLLFNLFLISSPPFLLSNKAPSFSWVYCCPAGRWHSPTSVTAGYAMKVWDFRKFFLKKQRNTCFFSFPSCCLDSEVMAGTWAAILDCEEICSRWQRRKREEPSPWWLSVAAISSRIASPLTSFMETWMILFGSLWSWGFLLHVAESNL